MRELRRNELQHGNLHDDDDVLDDDDRGGDLRDHDLHDDELCDELCDEHGVLDFNDGYHDDDDDVRFAKRATRGAPLPFRTASPRDAFCAPA